MKYLDYFLKDRYFRVARLWSNRELQRIAEHCYGDVINVSAWNDLDKNGRSYESYFTNANNYFKSNYDDFRGLQGNKNEFYLNLEQELDSRLIDKYDVVLNHTTLEHIYDFQTAFKNLALMSKDLLIIVVPFSQINHGNKIPDYWRFTPQSMKKLFEANNLEVVYSSANNFFNSGIYLFFIGSKIPSNWEQILNSKNISNNNLVGKYLGYSICVLLRGLLRRINIKSKIDKK